jgi:hypothetical protein
VRPHRGLARPTKWGNNAGHGEISRHMRFCAFLVLADSWNPNSLVSPSSIKRWSNQPMPLLWRAWPGGAYESSGCSDTRQRGLEDARHGRLVWVLVIRLSRLTSMSPTNRSTTDIGGKTHSTGPSNVDSGDLDVPGARKHSGIISCFSDSHGYLSNVARGSPSNIGGLWSDGPRLMAHYRGKHMSIRLRYKAYEHARSEQAQRPLLMGQ